MATKDESNKGDSKGSNGIDFNKIIKYSQWANWNDYFRILCKDDQAKLESYLRTGEVPIDDVVEFFAFMNTLLEAYGQTAKERSQLYEIEQRREYASIVKNEEINKKKREAVRVRRRKLQPT
jgi:hypothetical protein